MQTDLALPGEQDLDNLDNIAKRLQIGIYSRSTAELIQLALAAPEEDEDYLSERWHFVGLVQRRGTREILDRALELTQSASIEARSLGIDILGQLGIPTRTFPDECITRLLDLLDRECDPLLLRDICIALGHLNDPRSIEPLLKFRLHPDWEVRYGVVSGLSGCEDDRAISGLIKLSTDVCPHVRDWATFGLGTLTEVDTPAIREALYQRFLLEDCQDDETAEIYDEALMGLANRKDDRILARLIAQLMSDDVGTLAIQAAESMADDRLHPALLHLQTWWEPTCTYLDDALLACKPQ